VSAVACPAANSCVAVGARDLPKSVTRLAERWNGKNWLALTTPNPTGAITSQLSAVACASTTSCFAVGQFNTIAPITKTLVERWDGTRWTVLPSPNVTGAPVSVLAGVACATATSCVAVGSSFSSTDDTATTKTLAEVWNGSTWQIVPSPNQPIAGDSALAAVACTSATSCFAVGSYDTALVTSTLIERWDGSSWQIVPSPDPKGSTTSELAAVSCASSSSCTAVGTGHGSLIERWNGGLWGIVTSANPAGATGVSLSGVACPSASRCVAVGTTFRQINVQRLVETWNGTSWSTVNVPVPSKTVVSNLSGVSCASVSSCFGVGEYRLGSSRRPLFDRYA